MVRKRTRPLRQIQKNVLRAYLVRCALRRLHQVKTNTKVGTKRKHIHPKQSFVKEYFGSFVQSVKYFPVHMVVAVGLSVVIVAGSGALYAAIFKDLPTPADLTAKHVSLSTKILDRNGQLLYKIYQDENRTWLPLRDIPRPLIYATIAIEDQDFYYHHGFSIRGIVRAFLADLKGESVQGGSTLTQQLVKKRLLTPERTITRKLKELLLAVMVEQTYTKDQILEMYLNEIPYGGSAYGVEEASERYFGKSARELHLPEAALLAGLPVAPSVYSPFGPTPELSKQRQKEVLRRMVEDGYITAEDADLAAATPLPLQPDSIAIQAPHFVMYVRHLLAQQYGEDLLNRGGLEVRTTLDLELQQSTQETVTREVAALNKLRISNGAALVTNPQTGEILAMVGSTNYFDTAHDGQVNVTLSPRQPGSSIKPLMYSLGLERGLTPATLIEDTPITYRTEGSPPYSPKNYDGKYHGKVTMREALASSYNIPAVKTLNTLGVADFISHAEAMGITTWQERNRFGLSLTLGGGEVKMADLATAYGAFANGGHKLALNPILSVKSDDGTVLYQNPCSGDVAVGSSEKADLPGTAGPSNPDEACSRPSVVSAATAYQISSMLSDNSARTPAFGPLSVLHIPNQQVAVKTGTTNSLRDNWTIGYTSDRLVAVWVGNNDNTPMSYVASGITGASPIWNKIITPLLPKTATHAFAQPATVTQVAICAATNTLACKGCPRITQEFFKIGTQPKVRCGEFQTASWPAATPPPKPPQLR